MIEFKTIDGVQSNEQKHWQNIITEAGFQYSIIRTLEEFKYLIQSL